MSKRRLQQLLEEVNEQILLEVEQKKLNSPEVEALIEKRRKIKATIEVLEEMK